MKAGVYAALAALFVLGPLAALVAQYEFGLGLSAEAEGALLFALVVGVVFALIGALRNLNESP